MPAGGLLPGVETHLFGRQGWGPTVAAIAGPVMTHSSAKLVLPLQFPVQFNVMLLTPAVALPLASTVA